MLYLSQMIGEPVVDAQGERLGTISDLAISTGEVFPRITSLAFQGPGRVPFMISWRKYVDTFDDDGITLSVDAHDIRFSYLQPDEVLLARDLMDRQIVDTQGLKVVRVNDLKLSQSGTQLRLLGAEVGVRGILRGLHPLLEKAVVNVAKLFHKKVDEQLIAWNYMDLLDRDLSEVQLSVTHRRLDELHPADVADILEQLDPQQRASVFAHLDDSRATEAISEMEDEYQAEFIDDLPDARAAELIGNIALDAQTPIIAGEEGICSGCGVATLTISYYDIGYATGEMAYEILVNGADPAAMEIQYAPQFTPKYNPTMCEALGLTPPDGYEAIAE